MKRFIVPLSIISLFFAQLAFGQISPQPSLPTPSPAQTSRPTVQDPALTSRPTVQDRPGRSIINLANPLGNVRTLDDLLNRIIDFLIGIGAALATLMVLVGAFKYLTSEGDPGKVKEAHDIILMTAVGYGIILISKGIAILIKSILTG